MAKHQNTFDHLFIGIVFYLILLTSATALAEDQIEITPTEVTDKIESDSLPSPSEISEAKKILINDHSLGPNIKNGAYQIYEPMPMIPADDSVFSGALWGERVLYLGLRPLRKYLQHEIVGVSTETQKVIRFPNLAPPTSRAAPNACGVPSAGQSITQRGTAGSAFVNWKPDGEEIWRLKVIRPAASSGRWGSGVELRDVYYKGKLVFARAHVPILNVNYDRNRCGPFRDPVSRENAFNARGTQLAPGILRADQIPTTIFDTGNDRGNFRGVAVYERNGALVLTSEISAGWYRYVSEWRLYKNGTIEPIFKLSAVYNSCTCLAHDHHVYWRLDFDLEGSKPNYVHAKKNGTWAPVVSETMHLKRDGYQAWRVTRPNSNFGFEITPRASESPTNTYGQGDVWLLKHQTNEIDDSRFGSSTIAKLNRFLNGESLVDSDIVFWMAAHVRHASERHESDPIAGPRIVLLNGP